MSVILKRLLPENWKEYKTLRLEGMNESPEAFFSTYEEESQKTENEWKQWLEAYILGAYNDDNKLVGCMTLFKNTRQRDKHSAHIYGAYVKKDFRGMGIGKTLLKKIIEQAEISEVEILYLDCTVTQTAALKLYKSFGFQTYGTIPWSMRIGDRYLSQECMFLKLKK